MADERRVVGRRRRGGWREHVTGWLFVGPAAVVLGAFGLLPVLYAGYVSLHDWGLVKRGFVGLANYERAFGDPEFGRAMLVTVWYVLGTVPTSLGLGLLVANLLGRRMRGRAFYRTLYFLPYVTSVVAAAAVWLWIFYPTEAGLANAAFRALGLPRQDWVEESRGLFLLIGEHFGVRVPGWAGGPSLALVCVMVFSVWSSVGFDVVVLLAALASVPREVYDAAELDGATGWQRLRHITVPLISPTLFFLLIVSTIRAFRVFGQIYVMASKETARTAHNVTMYVFHWMYTGSDYGYSSAVALILFGVILLVTLVQMRAVGRRVHYG
jgi:multiple sugar transport system permease protein